MPGEQLHQWKSRFFITSTVNNAATLNISPSSGGWIDPIRPTYGYENLLLWSDKEAHNSAAAPCCARRHHSIYGMILKCLSIALRDVRKSKNKKNLYKRSFCLKMYYFSRYIIFRRSWSKFGLITALQSEQRLFQTFPLIRNNEPTTAWWTCIRAILIFVFHPQLISRITDAH